MGLDIAEELGDPVVGLDFRNQIEARPTSILQLPCGLGELGRQFFQQRADTTHLAHLDDLLAERGRSGIVTPALVIVVKSTVLMPHMKVAPKLSSGIGL